MPETTTNCLQFNGTSDYVEVPYAAALNPTQFTLSCWAKVEGGQGSYRSPVTCRDDSPQRGYILYAEETNKWACWIGNSSEWVGDVGPDIQIGVWTHLAITYDDTEVKLYINGNPAVNKNGNLSLNTARPLRIGAGTTEGNPQFFFNGKIADVRLWNVVHNKSDIDATMNQRLVGNETGLVGYWKLDGNAKDSQTNGSPNNGTLKSGTWVSDPDLKLSDPPKLSHRDNSASLSGTNMEIVVAAILTDLAAAQNLANEFSQQLSQKHQGSFTVPNIALTEVELDLRFVLEKIVKPASGIPNANILVDLDTLQTLPPEFISSLRLQAGLERYGWKTK